MDFAGPSLGIVVHAPDSRSPDARPPKATFISAAAADTEQRYAGRRMLLITNRHIVTEKI